MTTRYRLAALVAVPLVLIGAALAYAHQGGGTHGSKESHHIEMHLDHMGQMLTRIGASASQKSQIDGILRGAFTDLSAARKYHHEAFGQLHELLLAPSIDREKVEALRADQIKALDSLSRNFVSAFGNAAEVLSPEQRAALARQIREHHSG